MLWSMAYLTLFASILVSAPALGIETQSCTHKNTILYETAERTFCSEYKNGYVENGPIPSNRPIGHHVNQWIEFHGDEIKSCTDIEYFCIEQNQNIIAIPRGDITISTKYIIKGTIFTVRECLRSVGDRCQIAIIQGDCNYVRLAEGLRECAVLPGGRSESTQEGPVYYYIFNEDYGITAFGSGGGEDLTSNEKMAVRARTYVLQGKVGLFGPCDG